jgi:hypothetical protein
VKAAGCMIEAQGHIGIGETDVGVSEVIVSLRIVADSETAFPRFRAFVQTIAPPRGESVLQPSKGYIRAD